ncbi:MAG: methyltransferase domain-containing protein [Patescibacteria group bacterium]
MQYFFILGRNPALSSAEIAAIFGKRATFSSLSDEAILVDIQGELSANDVMPRLGGTVKFGKILEMPDELAAEDIAEILKNYSAKKIYFGFSFYKLEEDVSTARLKKESQKIKNLAMAIKDLLKDVKIQARWVTSKENNLSSVVVKKNKLLTEAGAELIFLIGKEKTYLGKTLAVQEFEDLSFRDYGRPARSMKVGLMPPKLAKTMINFAKVEKDETILDPFCGFGTILEEALLWGYKNLIGSDVNTETLSGARENLEWLKKNYQLPTADYQLLECDVHHLSNKFPPQSIDAIISEPYLGPPLKGDEPLEKIKETMKELSDLYLAAFQEFKKIIRPEGKISIIFPVFHTEKQDFFLPILDEIKKIGFTVADPLPKELRKYSFLKTTPRNSILYFRPDQFVRREILLFIPG